MTTPIFETPSHIVRIATRDDAPALAQFCLENPDYDIFLTGQVPDTDAWIEDFLTDLPLASFGWTSTHKFIACLAGQGDKIVAIMDVTLDMIAKGIGHIGLFQVAGASQGTGLAHDLYRALEDWFRDQGTIAIRLGVLDGNPRGMAFWVRHGYCKTRMRTGTAPTGKQHVSHVMYKPLQAMTLDSYRGLVPRDHPDTP
jgi:ribosomal protein S18 acetylase RimI-like enzyme